MSEEQKGQKTTNPSPERLGSVNVAEGLIVRAIEDLEWFQNEWAKLDSMRTRINRVDWTIETLKDCLVDLKPSHERLGSVKPHKCPVCDGAGVVAYPPGTPANQSFASSSSGPWPCHACQGTGVICG